MARLLAIVVMGTITALSGAAQAMELEKGFGNMTWAASLEDAGDCEKIEEKGDILFCMRHDQAHTLLGESIPAVLYGFYKASFFSVFIRVENEEAYRETKSRLVNRLGPPESSLDKEGMVAVLRWTKDKVRVELHNDRSVQGFQVIFY